MHYKVILRILGLLLMIFSISMLPPLAISYGYHDGTHMAFVSGFTITLLTGFIIWAPVYRVRKDLRNRDGFLITVLFWVVLGLFGAIPLCCQRTRGCRLLTLYLNHFQA